MKRILTMIVSLTMLTIMMTACGTVTSVPASEPETTAVPEGNAAVQSVPEAPAEPAYETEPVGAPDTQQRDGLSAFESDYGYTVSYAEDSLDYRRTEGYDEYIMRSDDVNAPFVFVCISRIGADFVESVTAAALGESPMDCTIGQAQMSAKYSELEEPWDGGEVIRRTYICPLSSGDALLIETQRYTQDGNDLYESWIMDLVNSIAA